MKGASIEILAQMAVGELIKAKVEAKAEVEWMAYSFSKGEEYAFL